MVPDKAIPVLAGKSGSDWLIQIPKGAWPLIEMVRDLPGRKWISEKKLWLAPDSKAARSFLASFGLISQEEVGQAPESAAEKKGCFPSGIRPSNPKLPPELAKAIAAFEERMILMRYSFRSRKSYLSHFEQFLRYFRDSHPTEISKHQIEQYIVVLVRQKGIAVSTQNQIINAIKFYYEKVLGLPRRYYEIVRPRAEHPLPNVLSMEEVEALLSKVKNLKHRCALTLAYSSGLRISEVTGLRVADVNFERRTLFIHHGKGAKDRYTVLSDHARQILEQYLKTYKPLYWLFEGAQHEQYSTRSLQAIFHRAKQAAGVNPYATFHSLRHSFATHCIETGYATATVKELLGHNSVKTTERYLHVARHAIENFRSPLDIWRERNNLG